MRVINQSHEILSLPETALQDIERAGRTCYQSETKGDPEKFVKMLVSKGHHAMIEFADITVKFITNRGVTHELVRHRMCSFAQESTRYVRYDGGMEFIRPVWCSDEVIGSWSDLLSNYPNTLSGAEFIWLRSMGLAEMEYCNLLNLGWKPQQAREVLPNSLKTEIVVKANVREWMHILKLRNSPSAHPQMQALMAPLQAELHSVLSVLFCAR